MKKQLLLISTIVTTTLFSQNVNIPDANFKSALLAHSPVIDSNFDNEIQVTEASVFTGTLILNNSNIADLTGIEAFTSLTKLYIQFNDLTSLDLSQNTQLTHLFCRTNQLTALNTSPLVNLQQLDCKWNQITSLDLSSNNALNSLDFRSNQLTTINTANLTNLTSYVCAQNLITSIDISNNLNLISFDCSYLNLPTLDLSNNTQLQYLDCWNGILSSIDVSNNPALIRFRCPYNQITSIDISNLINLDEFLCSDNLLTSLDVSNNTSLTDLRLGNNGVSSLDLSSNNLLEVLHINNTLISTVDLTNLLQLEDLNSKDTPINSFDFSNNLNLVYLNIQNNDLSSLDLTGLTDLEHLRANNNSIDSLDITTNTSLTLFTVGNNDLRYLDMRNGNNTNISSINMGSNSNLYCVSVDDSTYSENNWRTSTSAVHNNTVFNGDCEVSCFIPFRAYDTLSACTEYILNGNTITFSGNYNDTLNSISSCKDSIVRRTITIIAPTTSTDIQSACDSYTWIDGNIYTENNNSATFTMPNSAGCDSIITLSLSINNPDVSISQTNETLNADLTGAQYQWIDCSNNSLINGAVMPSFTATENGNYAVQITENGCVDTSSCFTISSTVLSNYELKNVSVYPNPVVDELNITFDVSNDRVINLMSANGELIKSLNTSNVNVNIDMEKLPKGIYIISIKESQKNLNYKITK